MDEHMLGRQLLDIWETLPLNPEAQLKTVREYAARVLGKELAAAAWLGRPNPAVLEGTCLVSEACGTREGFRAAMLELIRIDATRGDFDFAPAEIPGTDPGPDRRTTP